MCTSIVTQTTGPEICVVHAGSIKIHAGMTSPQKLRALALVAVTSLTVAGDFYGNGKR